MSKRYYGNKTPENMREKLTHAAWTLTARRPMLVASLLVLLAVASTGATAAEGGEILVGTSEEGSTQTGP
jgi:hypothetical protein